MQKGQLVKNANKFTNIQNIHVLLKINYYIYFLIFTQKGGITPKNSKFLAHQLQIDRFELYTTRVPT